LGTMKTTKLHNLKSTKKNQAFTLIEILIVVGIISLIVAIAIPALSTSKGESERRSAEGRAKVLNEGRDRAILKDLGGITSMEDWTNTFGNGTNGAEAAAAFLISNNLVRTHIAN